MSLVLTWIHFIAKYHIKVSLDTLSSGLDICNVSDNKPLAFCKAFHATFFLHLDIVKRHCKVEFMCLVNMPMVQKDSHYLMGGASPRAVETCPCRVSIILSSEYNCIGVLNWAWTIFTPGSSISKGMLGAILAATFKSPGQMVLIVLTEEGVLRPLPPSIPEGVLHPLC